MGSEGNDPQRLDAQVLDREKLLQAVLDSLPFWITAKDRNGRYLVVNSPLAAAHGLTTSDYIQGKNEQAPEIHLSGLDTMQDIDSEVLTTGSRVEKPRISVRLNSDIEQIRRLVKFPLRLSNNSNDGVIGWSEDVTEWVRLEDEIQENSRQMAEDIALAVEFQTSFLPPVKDTKFLQVGHLYQPHSGVSGDVFKWFYNREGEFNFFLGDATGHGIAAAFLTMMIHVCLSNTRGDLAPDEVMARLNTQISSQNLGGKFISGVFFRIKPNGEFLLSSAGHPPVIVIRKSESEPLRLSEGGMPLGWFREPPVPYTQIKHRLEPGDLVVAFTDGLTEWEMPDGDLFGVDRLVDYLAAHRDLDVNAIVSGLYETADGLCTGKSCGDDLTIFAFKFQG